MLGTLVIAAAALTTGVSEAAVAALGPTVTWTKRTSAGTNEWYSITSDATGLRLVAGVQIGNLHTSTNGGESWTERYPRGNANPQTWWSACDDRCETIAAVCVDNSVDISRDGGKTWTKEKVTDDDVLLQAVSVDATGDNIVVSSFESTLMGVYSKTGRSGVWTKKLNSASFPIALSGNGLKIAILDMDGHMRISHDAGASWSGNILSGVRWFAANRDCTTMVAPHIDANEEMEVGHIQVTTDGGLTWNSRIATSDGTKRKWSASGLDNTGKIIVISETVGINPTTSKLYASFDGGFSWAQQTIDIQGEVKEIAVSGDGTHIAVAVYKDFIYTGVVNPLPGPAGWLAWEYQTAMGVALGATTACVPIGAAALREK